MSTQVQYRRGSNVQIAAFTGALGELVIDTTNKIVVVNDGTTAGGFPQVGLTATQTLTNKIYQGTSVSVSGNVTGGNITTAGIVSAAGNITTSAKALIGLSSTTLTNPIAVFNGAGASYSQLAVQNPTGTGSADIATYGNNGDDNQSWTDMGFTGNTFSDSTYSLTAPGDGYLFVQGNTSFGGNLVVATGTTGTTRDIVFGFGFQTASEFLRLQRSTNTVLPYANTTANLGSSSKYFNNLYVSAVTAASTISAVGNVSGGNVNTGGNVTGNWMLPTTGVSTGGNITVGGYISCAGNLYVANIVSTANLVTNDPLVYFNNTSAYPYNYDIGFFSGFVGGTGNTYQHTSIFRDYNDNTWKFASNIPEPAGTTMDLSNAIYDPVKMGGLTVSTIASNSTISASGTITGGNLATAGTASAGGNITGANLLTASGIVSAGGNITGGNITTAGVITVNSNNAVTAIVNGGSNGVGNIGSSTTNFNTVFAKATTAQYADLAEMYVADQTYAPGTLVVFGGNNEITISTASHDPSVAGIISTDPAYLMNSAQPGDNVLAVALTGRVPCRVVGSIRKGDRLVSNGLHAGVASALDMSQYQPGCIIGKALENYQSTEVGTIEVAVGRT